MGAGDKMRWFLCRAPRPSPRLRLFCIPFAGCGASAFNAWPAAFPDTIELHAAQLPGRESRYSEPALSDVHDVVRRMGDAIEPYLDRHYALFGYSMGAWIAFELIRELRRRGAPVPIQFFAASMRAPQISAAWPPLSQLPRDQFLERISEYFDSPWQTWANPDLLAIVLPVLRADMALCESYVYREEPPFAFPIQVFCGLRDRSTPLADAQAWRAQTTGNFALEVLEGSHFFPDASLARLQQVMLSAIAAFLNAMASS
jgi:surfactin synthase thioesterase subunit